MISKLLKKDSKGFTLMEMLIVVAIIVILVAIMIPTFASQLEKAREAADIANIRSAYAQAMVDALTSEDSIGEATSEAMVQTTKGWSSVTWPAYLGEEELEVEKGDKVTITVAANGTVKCEIAE